MISDISVLNGLINKICPDKTAEIYKVMRHPEKIIEKMAERDKLQLMKLLIKRIVVNYDTMEITWSDLALSLLFRRLLDCLGLRQDFGGGYRYFRFYRCGFNF